MGADPTEVAVREMTVNYFGTPSGSRVLAPIIATRGGGALANVLSVSNWSTSPMNGSYCASKAAACALTDGLLLELAHQKTQAVGVYASSIDTDTG
ncbi:UNVERIFIED_ORG: NAD(P)-dependent dehydrogenase (short-subunit alcohol dehydrogenase family) [Paraburkholderia sediminicola]|nr:NAD(P)-dependent dehydrogenase (short-subunit alcohol dehydrogenase family) [Paraburkholderia sediminicola]